MKTHLKGLSTRAHAPTRILTTSERAGTHPELSASVMSVSGRAVLHRQTRPKESVPLLLQLPMGTHGFDSRLAGSTAASAETWATVAVPCPDLPHPFHQSSLFLSRYSLRQQNSAFTSSVSSFQKPPTNQTQHTGLPTQRWLTHVLSPRNRKVHCLLHGFVLKREAFISFSPEKLSESLPNPGSLPVNFMWPLVFNKHGSTATNDQG